LPYLDYVQVDLVEDAEVRLLQISQGKFDASFRGTDDPRNIPFLDEQAEANDYQLYLGWVNGAGAWPGWLINQDYIGDGKDPELDAEIREVLRDKRFRRALSHALDRDRVIQVVWDGFGEAKQATISPQSWHFQSEKGQEVYKRWAESYVEFDQDLANSLLDEVGLTERDADGYRMLPSGKDFTIILDLGDWGGEFVGTEGTEIFRDSLDAVGLNVIVNNLVNQPDWDLRQTQGLYMLRNMHASELDVWTYPDWLFPVRDNRSFPLQGKWKQTGGAEGEKPVEGSAVARLQDLYDQGASESDPQKRHELVWEAIDILIEEGPFMIGASGDQPMPVVIKNNFHNVATSGVLGPWAPGSPGNQHPEQYWIEE
jgi:peptide/nickel transport system substrate-binding protein